MSFPAGYAGVCGCCQEAFFVGDPITEVEGEYCHEDCAQTFNDDD